MCQAATQEFKGLLACRVLLGIAEAGFWPAVLFHMSFWYPANRMPLRIAVLYTAGQLAGMLSGVLAFGISYMNGLSGLAGWRYYHLRVLLSQAVQEIC
jgi:MFS family permease